MNAEIDLPTQVPHQVIWFVVNPRNEVFDLRFLNFVICSCASLGPKMVVGKFSHRAEVFSIGSEDQLLIPSDTVSYEQRARELGMVGTHISPTKGIAGLSE
jgi:hypothetical protein